MKKWLVLLVSAVLAICCLAACGGNSQNNAGDAANNADSAANGGSEGTGDSETITIRFLHQWAEENRLPYWQELVDAYMEENPNVVIEMEAISNEPYKDKMRVILGGDDVPDLFFTWDGDYVARLAKAGAIMDLTPYLEAEPEFHESFNQGLLTTGQVDGKQYGLPVRTCVNFFLYNKEIFEENGITELPETWDEFLDICEKLKNNDVTPLALGNAEAWPLLHYISALNLRLVPEETFNNDYYLVTGEFTDPAYIESLQIMLDFYNNGYFMDGANSTPMAAAREMFNAGRTAMIHDQVGSFKSYYYDTMGGDNWGIFPMPAFEGAQGNSDMMVGWIDQFVMSSSCEHPEAVIDFLKFFYSEENQKKMTEELGFVSTITSVSEDTSFNPCEQINEAMEIINQCSGFTATIDLEMNASVASVYQASVQELFTGKTPEEIMASVQEAAKLAMEDQAG